LEHRRPTQKKKDLTLPIQPIGPWRFTPDSKSVVTLIDQSQAWLCRALPDGLSKPISRNGNAFRFGDERNCRSLSFSRCPLAGDQSCRWRGQSLGFATYRQTCQFNSHLQRAIPREFTAEGKKLLLIDDAKNSLHEGPDART
jgi:hypothetical protein